MIIVPPRRYYLNNDDYSSFPLDRMEGKDDLNGGEVGGGEAKVNCNDIDDYYALLESEPIDSVHPDKQPNSDTDRFISLSRAAAVLGDPPMRAKYDRWRSAGLVNVSFNQWLELEASGGGGSGHWRNPNPFASRLLAEEKKDDSVIDDRATKVDKEEILTKFRNYEI